MVARRPWHRHRQVAPPDPAGRDGRRCAGQLGIGLDPSLDHLALGSSGRQPISGTTNVGAISDAVDLASVEPGERVALLVGGEGHGLSARWMAAADRRVRIPMRAGVDSLNVAAATAVACYVLGR
ncbi:hypothetical protein E1269_13305 [Jiangella asiatica]|uniref:tRNA/rRNA methyltransferase SpoU type domain-containing protein n=1 Tax=Jiangella asiatica TaxID=2530372 RepID=A0A4R5DDL8_9ACTN|nr:hypothetical protein E1269_13305 [Jiangella asiatica]